MATEKIGTLRVVKIGGNVVDNTPKLEHFLEDFTQLSGAKILIHGGGKIATALGKSMGVETVMIDGRRVTDSATLDLVTMVYAGLINKGIVARMQTLGSNAIGLCGADGGLIRAVRRVAHPVDYGFVGDPIEVAVPTARALLDAGLVPVIAPITHDAQGQLLNTNADTVAQTIATAMAGSGRAVELIYCFEKRGVLLDVDDDSTVVPEINRQIFSELKTAGVVADGMLPKLENAFKAIDKGVSKVVICSAERISEKGYAGTTCL